MSQKKWKFNVIDVIVVILIVAVVALLAVKLGGRGGDGSQQMTYTNIRYTVVAQDQPVAVYEGVKAHIPGTLMASGARHDGQEIVSVTAEPVLVVKDGRWLEDPDHVDIYFTVEGSVEVTPVMTTTVGMQEIRVGREIILKTEYIEFDPVIVTSVEFYD